MEQLVSESLALKEELVSDVAQVFINRLLGPYEKELRPKINEIIAEYLKHPLDKQLDSREDSKPENLA